VNDSHLCCLQVRGGGGEEGVLGRGGGGAHIRWLGKGGGVFDSTGMQEGNTAQSIYGGHNIEKNEVLQGLSCS